MITASSTLIESFNPDDESNIGPRWNKWIARLNQFFKANGMKVDDSDDKMLNTLFLLGGERLYEIHNTLDEDISDENVTTEFDKACFRLKAYFNPKRNKIIEEFKFRATRQDPSETIEMFVTRLRVVAKFCEKVEREITSQVIQTCVSSRFRRQLLKEKDLDLKKLLELGRVHDTIENQVKLVESPQNEEITIDIIKSNNQNTKRNSYKNSNSSKRPLNRHCFNCGGTYPHEKSCPAKGKTCHSCGKTNHFEKMCKKKAN